MTWYDYEIAYNGFVADLIAKLIAEGWTQTEGGFNTVQPAGYSAYYLIDALTYGLILRGDGTSSTSNFTYMTIHLRATYNAGTHVPTTTANGGDARFRLVYNVDLTAEAVKKMIVKGWIDSTHAILYISADATQGNYMPYIVFMGEVEAVGAGANTCMLNSPEVLNPVGDGAYNASQYPPDQESHFVHILGDGCGYYPIAYGLGGSDLDSKVRPGQVPIWKYRADGVNRLGDIAFRISPSISRPSYTGAEAAADTFTDTDPAPDETFTRVPYPTVVGTYYEGYFFWHRYAYNSSPSIRIEPIWIRSA